MSMSFKQVQKAEKEARRFLDALTMVTHLSVFSDDKTTIYGDMHTAALKRASMDLTRALAQMRKSG